MNILFGYNRGQNIFYMLCQKSIPCLLTLELFLYIPTGFSLTLVSSLRTAIYAHWKKPKYETGWGFFISRESSGKGACSLKLMGQNNLQIANMFIKNKENFFFFYEILLLVLM